MIGGDPFIEKYVWNEALSDFRNELNALKMELDEDQINDENVK